MAHAAIRDWLRKKALAEVVFSALSGVAAVAGSAAACGVVVGVAHFFVLLFVVRLSDTGTTSGKKFVSEVVSGFGLAMIATAVLPALFAAYEWMRRRRKARDAQLRAEVWQGTLVNRDDPAIDVAAELVFIGPRLAYAAVELFKKALRLTRLDREYCSQVLLQLLGRDSRVSYREICAAIPELNPTKIFPQLRDIVGVVFLVREPCGLTLTKELREELQTAWRRSGEAAHQAIEAVTEIPGGREADERSNRPERYRARGLDSEASLPELERAYHRLMKEHDPARVAGMGAELEEIAQETAEDIYEAYKELLERHERRNRE